MSLVPCGRVRVMQAQCVNELGSGQKEVFAQIAEDPARQNVTQQTVGQGADTSGVTGATPEATEQETVPTGIPDMTPSAPQQTEHLRPEQSLNIGKEEASDNQSKFQNSLTKFVLQQIIHWKWPERLAVTKQEEMVDEKILPDGNRNFTIIVPNIYYGGDVISNEDFQSFIKNLTAKFGIHFQGASRKGKKATLNFSTTQRQMQIDPLDDVYGKGSGSAPKAKAAYTMGEILTARKEDLYQTMRKIAMENH